MIIECTEAFIRAVAEENEKTRLSPPLRFGRVTSKPLRIDRYFVGLCTEREMHQHVMKVEALINEGGNAVERRIRGLA